MDRYDGFSDICFSLTAGACGSDLGSYGLVLFVLGVILPQMLPALVLLFTERSTHMALRFNGLLLFLEIIDPSRAELELPDAVKAVAVGNLHDPPQQVTSGSETSPEKSSMMSGSETST